jgi:hypothetical protein
VHRVTQLQAQNSNKCKASWAACRPVSLLLLLLVVVVVVLLQCSCKRRP